MIARRCDASAANRCLCEEPVEMPRRSTGRFSTVVQTDKNVFSELLGTLLVRAVFFFSFSSILGILMTYLCGVLVLASSICWLMRQLASIMFFLLHLLIITLTFCPSEPLLMMLYFVQHDRLLMRTAVCFLMWRWVEDSECEQNNCVCSHENATGCHLWRGMACERRITHKNWCSFIAKSDFQLFCSFLYGGHEGQNTTKFAKTQLFQDIWNAVVFGKMLCFF